jgi:hypothetical protein
VKAERIGQVGKCPSCGSKIVIALDPPSEPEPLDWPVSDEPFPAELINTIEPVAKPAPGQLLNDMAADEEATTLQDLYERTRRSQPVVDEPIEEVLEIEVQNTPKEYKVLTQKDKWFTAKFDPEVLERAINAYAQQGWVVKAMTTATIPGFGGNREELIILLER